MTSPRDDVKFLRHRGVTLLKPFPLKNPAYASDLDRKHHIKQVCKKISFGAWAIARLRNYVNTCTLKSVHYSLIHSHLLYCKNTWESASSCNLKPFKIFQKLIIRLIAGSEYRAPSSTLFSQLQILQLDDIHTFEVAKRM